MSWTTGTQTEALGSANAVGSAYASSAAATAVSPASGAGYCPANFFLPSYAQGKKLLIKASGVLSTTGTPTLVVGVTANTTQGTYNSGAILATSAVAGTAQASSVTNVPWELECNVVCVEPGSSGTFLAYGLMKVYTASTTLQSMRLSSSTANPNTTASLSTQSAYFMELFATWGTSSASNSLQVFDYTVLGLN